MNVIPLTPFAVALLLAPVESAPAHACGDSLNRVFEVRRGDQPIGTHSIRFSQDGADTQVDIEIDLRVTFGPFTMFRYEHTNREIWRDGQLVSLETATNDDGDSYRVSARATPDGLEVANNDEIFIAPLDILPTSYWNADTLARSELLDTQRGTIASIAVERGTRQAIDLGNTSGIAQRSEISGDLDLSVWYTDEGQLGRIAFTARGSEIDYRLLCTDQPSP